MAAKVEVLRNFRDSAEAHKWLSKQHNANNAPTLLISDNINASLDHVSTIRFDSQAWKEQAMYQQVGARIAVWNSQCFELRLYGYLWPRDYVTIERNAALERLGVYRVLPLGLLQSSPPPVSAVPAALPNKRKDTVDLNVLPKRAKTDAKGESPHQVVQQAAVVFDAYQARTHVPDQTCAMARQLFESRLRILTRGQDDSGLSLFSADGAQRDYCSFMVAWNVMHYLAKPKALAAWLDAEQRLLRRRVETNACPSASAILGAVVSASPPAEAVVWAKSPVSSWIRLQRREPLDPSLGIAVGGQWWLPENKALDLLMFEFARRFSRNKSPPVAPSDTTIRAPKEGEVLLLSSQGLIESRKAEPLSPQVRALVDQMTRAANMNHLLSRIPRFSFRDQLIVFLDPSLYKRCTWPYSPWPNPSLSPSLFPTIKNSILEWDKRVFWHKFHLWKTEWDMGKRHAGQLVMPKSTGPLAIPWPSLPDVPDAPLVQLESDPPAALTQLRMPEELEDDGQSSKKRRRRVLDLAADEDDDPHALAEDKQWAREAHERDFEAFKRDMQEAEERRDRAKKRDKMLKNPLLDRNTRYKLKLEALMDRDAEAAYKKRKADRKSDKPVKDASSKPFDKYHRNALEYLDELTSKKPVTPERPATVTMFAGRPAPGRFCIPDDEYDYWLYCCATNPGGGNYAQQVRGKIAPVVIDFDALLPDGFLSILTPIRRMDDVKLPPKDVDTFQCAWQGNRPLEAMDTEVKWPGPGDGQREREHVPLLIFESKNVRIYAERYPALEQESEFKYVKVKQKLEEKPKVGSRDDPCAFYRRQGSDWVYETREIVHQEQEWFYESRELDDGGEPCAFVYRRRESYLERLQQKKPPTAEQEREHKTHAEAIRAYLVRRTDSTATERIQDDVDDVSEALDAQTLNEEEENVADPDPEPGRDMDDVDPDLGPDEPLDWSEWERRNEQMDQSLDDQPQPKQERRLHSILSVLQMCMEISFPLSKLDILLGSACGKRADGCKTSFRIIWPYGTESSADFQIEQLLVDFDKMLNHCLGPPPGGGKWVSSKTQPGHIDHQPMHEGGGSRCFWNDKHERVCCSKCGPGAKGKCPYKECKWMDAKRPILPLAYIRQRSIPSEYQDRPGEFLLKCVEPVMPFREFARLTNIRRPNNFVHFSPGEGWPIPMIADRRGHGNPYSHGGGGYSSAKWVGWIPMQQGDKRWAVMEELLRHRNHLGSEAKITKAIETKDELGRPVFRGDIAAKTAYCPHRHDGNTERKHRHSASFFLIKHTNQPVLHLNDWKCKQTDNRNWAHFPIDDDTWCQLFPEAIPRRSKTRPTAAVSSSVASGSSVRMDTSV